MNRGVIDATVGAVSFFKIAKGAGGVFTIDFADKVSLSRAQSSYNPGSFGGALLRQAISNGLYSFRKLHPNAPVSDNVNRWVWSGAAPTLDGKPIL